MSLLIAMILPFFSFAQDASVATLYDLKSNQTTKLYTLNIETREKEDGTHTLASFKDLEGVEVAREQALIKGAQILSYSITQGQTAEHGKFFLEGGKIYFEYEGKGKRKTASEKNKGTILCTANFSAFVRENWDALLQGRTFDVRFAVWDRLETVGFSLQKIGEVSRGGDKWMELRFKPTNFIIAALVDPIYLWYSLADKKLMAMKGRVTPKIKKGGRWKDLDSEVIYTYDQKSVSK